MIRRVNLALMETVLAERRRQEPAAHPLAEYVSDWTRVHTPPYGQMEEREQSFTISLNGQDD
ncbi:MAG: hypothetical protein M9924_13130 [Rhizobiaceae bacterium]|nr:hypothetical protein [Rhizobiaceae bacterium]